MSQEDYLKLAYAEPEIEPEEIDPNDPPERVKCNLQGEVISLLKNRKRHILMYESWFDTLGLDNNTFSLTINAKYGKDGKLEGVDVNSQTSAHWKYI